MVLATSTLMIKACKDAQVVAPVFAIDNFTLPFEWILCIYYPVQFKKDQAKVQALINFDNEVNTMNLTYIVKLSFKIRSINIKAQKIDGFIFDTLDSPTQLLSQQ